MAGINYTPPATVRKFMLSEHEFRVIMGPIGSGKSAGCCIEILRQCMLMPPSPDGYRRSKWAVIRNTRPQLKDTTLQTWLQWIPAGVLGKWKESEMIFYLEFNDVKAEILFRPLDTPDDVQRVLSLELTGAWFNEAREIPLEILQAVQGRLGRYPRKADVPNYRIGVIADTNPPEEGTTWHKIIEHMPQEENNENSVLECESFVQPSGLAPNAENTENLRDGYYANLARGKTQQWIDVYIHGMYAASQAGKPVYIKQYKKQHQASSAIKIYPTLPVICGHDFGRTPAAAFIQQQLDGRIKVLRECVSFDMGLKSFSQRMTIPMIRQTFPDNPIIFVGDPSGIKQNDTDDNSCLKELKALFPREDGYYVKTAHTNDPNQRINTLSEVLSQFPDMEPLIEVDPSCKWILEALRSKYRYARKKGADEFHDRPDKNNWSHIMEALQYAVMFLCHGRFYAEDYTKPKTRASRLTLPIHKPGDSYAGY